MLVTLCIRKALGSFPSWVHFPPLGKGSMIKCPGRAEIGNQPWRGPHYRSYRCDNGHCNNILQRAKGTCNFSKRCSLEHDIVMKSPNSSKTNLTHQLWKATSFSSEGSPVNETQFWRLRVNRWSSNWWAWVARITNVVKKSSEALDWVKMSKKGLQLLFNSADVGWH